MSLVLNRLADSTLSELEMICADIANPAVHKALQDVETIWKGRYKNRTANPDKIDEIVKDLRWLEEGIFGQVAPNVISHFVFMANVAGQWDKYLDEEGDTQAGKMKMAKRALNTVVYDGKTLNQVVWEVFTHTLVNGYSSGRYNTHWYWDVANSLVGAGLLENLADDSLELLLTHCSEYCGGEHV